MAAESSKKSSRITESPEVSAGSSDQLNPSGKIDEMIAGLGDWRGDWLAEIRRLIREVDTE